MIKKITSFLTFLLIVFNISAFADIASTRAVLSENCANHENVLSIFDTLAASWEEFANEHWDMERLLGAVEYSAKKHKGQTRDDARATPYIVHPLGVTQLVWETGNVRSINVLTAALLHDTLEDTDATTQEIEALFGKRVATTVQEVTDDPTLSSAENKQRQIDHAPHMSLDAQIVKLADRFYNVRDLTIAPPTWPQETIDRYVHWGEKLLSSLRGVNAGLELSLKKAIDQHRHDKRMREAYP